MRRTSIVEEQFKNIFSMMENMEPAEREKLSDKLLSYLLFNPHHLEQIAVDEFHNENTKETSASLSEEEQELLKKISEKTAELYRKMGDNPLDNC